MLILVLGPVRSGKSARAAALAHATRLHVIVAATAAEDADDREWSERIARHRKDRPQAWDLVETARPHAPSLATLLRDAPADACIIVDALGTWLAHELLAWNDAAVRKDSEAALGLRCAELIGALRDCTATTIVVAEETGWGLVPVTPLGRRFRDALGRLTQRVGAIADRVELVVAGFAIDCPRDRNTDRRDRAERGLDAPRGEIISNRGFTNSTSMLAPIANPPARMKRPNSVCRRGVRRASARRPRPHPR